MATPRQAFDVLKAGLVAKTVSDRDLYVWNATNLSLYENGGGTQDTYSTATGPSSANGVLQHVSRRDKAGNVKVQLGDTTGSRTFDSTTTVGVHLETGPADALKDVDLFEIDVGGAPGLFKAAMEEGDLVAVIPVQASKRAAQTVKMYIGFDGTEGVPPPNPVLLGVVTTATDLTSTEVKINAYVIGEHFQPAPVPYTIPMNAFMSIDSESPDVNALLARAAASIGTGLVIPDVDVDDDGDANGSIDGTTFSDWYDENVLPSFDGDTGKAYGDAVTNPFLRGYARGTSFSDINLQAAIDSMKASGRSPKTLLGLQTLYTRLYGALSPTNPPVDATPTQRTQVAQADAADLRVMVEDAQVELAASRAYGDGLQQQLVAAKNRLAVAMARITQLTAGGGGPPVVPTEPVGPIHTGPTGPGTGRPDAEAAAELRIAQDRIKSLAMQMIALKKNPDTNAARIAVIERELALQRTRILAIQDASR